MKRFLFVILAALFAIVPARAAEPAKVYVILWFDTEDYILPASDDAALHVADFLSREGIRATFKVVGEKARTLEKRRRADVIAALKKHEIGYHSNFHSVPPSPALYLSNLGWDEGVAEFDRREKPGLDDVKHVFGQTPTCYGQPGSSWGPQSFGAMQKWDMSVYLDAGKHVGLDGKPHYFCGAFTLYDLKYTMRADLKKPKELDAAKEKFADARKALLAEGGGVVSIVYHPCEFVHKEFWDGANFRKGANPPREQWKLPAQQTAEESKQSYAVFEEYIRFIKRFEDVKFITASEAAKLYSDRAAQRRYTRKDLQAIAERVGDAIDFQRHEGYTLSAAEVLLLLNSYVAGRYSKAEDRELSLTYAPTVGPTGTIPDLKEPVTTDWSQFGRTAVDVRDFIVSHERVPSAVWLGSTPVPPEAYLRALAEVAKDLLDGKEPPKMIAIKPTKLAAAQYVSADDPKLWGWVIFPPGFRAPALMELAKKQAWTIKPAVLH